MTINQTFRFQKNIQNKVNDLFLLEYNIASRTISVNEFLNIFDNLLYLPEFIIIGLIIGLHMILVCILSILKRKKSY